MQDFLKPAMRLGLFAFVAGAMIGLPALLGHSVRADAGSQLAARQKILVRYEATALLKPDAKAPQFASAAREAH